MAPRGVKRPRRVEAAWRLIHRCVRDPGRPADVTPELLGQQPPGPAAARTHDRRLVLLAKATNGLAITRRHPATGVAVQWALLGIRSRLGWEGLSFCGVDPKGGSSGTGHDLAFRRDAGERPPRGAYGPFAPVPSSCLTASTKVGLRLRSRGGGSRRRPCCGSASSIEAAVRR